MNATVEWVVAHLHRFWRLAVTYIAERLVHFSAIFVPALVGVSAVDLGRIELYLTAAALAHSIGPLGTENAMMHSRFANIRGYWGATLVVALVGGAVIGLVTTFQLDLGTVWIGVGLGAAFSVMHVSRNRIRITPSIRPLGVSTALLTATFGLFMAAGLLADEAVVEWVGTGLVLGAVLASIPAFRIMALRGESAPTRLSTLMRFGAPLSFAAAFSEIVTSADRYIIHFYMGVEPVGTYGVAYRLIMLVSGAASTIVYWWQSEALRNRAGWARSQLSSYQRVAGTVVLVGAAVAWWPMTTILANTLDTSFSSVGALTAWLLISIIGFVILSGYVSALIAEDRTTAVGLITGLNAVLNIALNFALIPHFELAGAAFATAVSQVTAAAAAAVVFRRRQPPGPA